MSSVFLAIYGLYFVMVGVRGNACQLFTDLQEEKQFLYWVIILLVLLALWETPVGEELAKPAAVLIVLGFLLANNNYQTIGANLKQVLPAL